VTGAAKDADSTQDEVYLTLTNKTRSLQLSIQSMLPRLRKLEFHQKFSNVVFSNRESAALQRLVFCFCFCFSQSSSSSFGAFST